MNNWINRLAIFAVVGAILSSAVLVGCGGGDDDADTAVNNTAPAMEGEGLITQTVKLWPRAILTNKIRKPARKSGLSCFCTGKCLYSSS